MDSAASAAIILRPPMLMASGRRYMAPVMHTYRQHLTQSEPYKQRIDEQSFGQ